MLKGKATKLIGSTVISQALLSGANFAVAFLLLRRLGTETYGYYVLIATGILFFVILQNAFFHTLIISALASPDKNNLDSILGGFIKRRRQFISIVFLLVVLTCLLLALTGYIPTATALLFLAGAASGTMAAWREFNRGFLLAQHLGGDALKADFVYSVLLLSCSFVATFLTNSSLMAVCSIGVASGTSAWLSSRYLWKFMPWSKEAEPTPIRAASSLGGWAALGAGVHWSFSQGYVYIVAGLLDVHAVAAIAATRLLLMPVNLLSTGVNQALYPLISRWNAAGGIHFAVTRTIRITVVIVAGCLGYVLLAWLMQDWFFLTLMHQDVLLRQQLVIYWSVLVIVMLLRDEISCLLVVRMKVKILSYITSSGAVASLIGIFLLIPWIGVQGALLGVIIGELLNIAGMLVILFTELRNERRQSLEAA